MSDIAISPVTGIARKKRSDAGVLRKSTFDNFVDLFREMSPSQQSTALEVLRQIQRLGAHRVTERHHNLGDLPNAEA